MKTYKYTNILPSQETGHTQPQLYKYKAKKYTNMSAKTKTKYKGEKKNKTGTHKGLNEKANSWGWELGQFKELVLEVNADTE